MSAPPKGVALTLGVYPSKWGFGWVAFSSPLHLYDRGSVWAHREKNLRCVIHFERLLRRLHPELVVMEDPAQSPGFRPRSKRVLELQSLLKSTALELKTEVALYHRDDVQTCFATVGARSLHEMAETIARSFPDLAHRLPRKRQAWETEGRRMAVFCATALVLTHFHMDGRRWADRMKS